MFFPELMAVTSTCSLVKRKGNTSETPSASPVRLNLNEQVVVSNVSISFLYSAVYYLPVHIALRPSLRSECKPHLNQTRSLSYSYIYPSESCILHVLSFNPAPRNQEFSCVQCYTCGHGGVVPFDAEVPGMLPGACRHTTGYGGATTQYQVLSLTK